ncbi:hypothetical protein [Spiroplasma floricola]|uniref:Uncharacterized protein n=1 Tax=Spiroplasma floricola 23-6 TaxID=1336749 RepID=A0A2K8SEC8_9MOLU|nr:hypothetical protein [Spiroplasma floricola]AUB31807.1 hypothetical protein SFLOR_v1c07590 [Spiroplasma floricola 23-6]
MKIFNGIGTYFQIHWKLIVSTVAIFTIFIVGIFMLPLISSGFTIVRGSIYESSLSGSGSISGTYESMIPLELIYNIFFKSLGLAIYGFVMITFIDKILLKEISSTQISLWLTQPLTKTQIILMKYLFLLLVITVMYIPALIVLLIMASFTQDAKNAYNNIVLGFIQIYFFLIMLSSIFFIMSLLLTERATMFNVIASLILGYFILIGILELIYLVSNSQSQAFKIVINYIGLQAFITNVFNYDLDAEPVRYILSQEIIGSGSTRIIFIETPVLKEINKASYSSLIVISISISFALAWLSTIIFKKISFNI